MAQPNLSVIQGKKEDQNAISKVNQNNLKKQQESIDLSKNVLTKLTNRLHAKLDLQDLIISFSNEITPFLSLDDVVYQLPDDNSIINNKGRHYVSYNLEFNEEALGEIYFIRRYRFIENEHKFIEKLLIALLSPLYNAYQYHQLQVLAQTDPLTGALNRMGLDKNFKREVDLAKRNNSDLSMLLFDADHFKKINDNYGHDVGDKVLKNMAMHINECIRGTDVFARFGGEEFIVLLNNTNRSGAFLLAERIRQSIESSISVIHDQEIKYTASIGVATLQDRDTQESLLKRADEALYEAKNNGRNRVVLK